MVDVGDKKVTKRTAEAIGYVFLPAEVVSTMRADGRDELSSPKGPVFTTAIIAGTMAVKQTSNMIPFCHPLPIDGVKISIDLVDGDDESIPGCDPKVFPAVAKISCHVKVTHKTGVEMEALAGVSAAALTVYDMCKAASQDMVISSISLVRKTGGKSDINKI